MHIAYRVHKLRQGYTLKGTCIQSVQVAPIMKVTLITQTEHFRSPAAFPVKTAGEGEAEDTYVNAVHIRYRAARVSLHRRCHV